MSIFTSGTSEIINDQIQNTSDEMETNGCSDDLDIQAYTMPIGYAQHTSFHMNQYPDFFPSYPQPRYTSDSCDSNKETDDNSDSDEEDAIRENKKNYKKLKEIKSRIGALHEMLYKEKLKEVEEKLVRAKSGTGEYEKPVRKLKEHMMNRLEVASALKELKITSIMHKYEAEMQATRQNFENEKTILYDKMKEELEGKLEELKKERIDANFDVAVSLSGASKSVPGRGRGRGGRGRRHGEPFRKTKPKSKPVTFTEPYIVHMLTDEEILEDWTAIQKLLSPFN